MSADYNMLNIVSLGVCFILKNCTGQIWRICLIQRQNSHYFQCPVGKTKSW